MTQLSVIIPCYNEKNTIEKVVEKVKKSEILKQIIIIDDGSTDGTKELLKKKDENFVDKIIYHETNLGKGASVKSGIENSSGEIIIVQDADLEYDPQEYTKIINPIIEDKADVVYGARFLATNDSLTTIEDSFQNIKNIFFHTLRFLSGKKKGIGYFWNIIANYLLTSLSNLLTGLKLNDMETGYKCFKKKAIEDIILEEKGFGFDPEITAKLAKKKCRFNQVSISYNARTYEQGKKISKKDGLVVVYCIFKYNLF